MSAIIEKKNLVQRLVDLFKNKEGIIVSDYSGLDANQLTELRKRVTNSGAFAHVEKNSMIKRSFETIKLSYPNDLLTGPNLYFRADSGMPDLCKILVDFAKEFDALEIKGGMLNGDYVDAKQIIALSKLPSREELVAKAVGLIKSPLTGLVGTLSSPLRGFINVLNGIKNNK